MTEQLKTMMDRAADQDFAAVDLDAITSAGDRTVRRRRLAAGASGFVLLAAIVTGAAVLGGDGGDSRTDFVDDPFRTDVPMWTEGSVLHTPDATYDLGVDVASFVRTSEGIAFLGWDTGETWNVYLYGGEGDPERVGVTQDSRLRADPTAPYVGWLDGTGDDLETVIYDQRSGEQVYGAPAKLEYSYPIAAVDGERAYLADADEGPVHVLDLADGKLTDLRAAEWSGFLAAEGGLVARQVCCSGGGSSKIEIGRPDGAVVALEGQSADGAAFSPGGRWLSLITGSVAVFDTTSGQEVAVDISGFSDGIGYEWLDDDTLVVAGASERDQEIALLTCEIPSGTCTEVSRLPWVEGDAVAAIGLGEVIWGPRGSDSGADSAESTSVAEPPE